VESLRIAVLVNRKHHVKPGLEAPPDALAEYDADETVAGLESALRGSGHEVVVLEADETLVDSIRRVAPDLCFNIAEGLRGDAREAQIPALLELLGIPYTASKVLTNAISLDKVVTKRIWRDHGLPTAAFQSFSCGAEPLDPRLSFPLFVKPAREGSGMGINARSIVHDEDALREQMCWVIQTYRQPALVERYLPGREFTVGLVGNTRLPGQPRRSEFYDERGFHVFPVLEIDTQKGAVKGLYNTQAKSYAIEDEQAPGYICPTDIPADLDAGLKRLAVAAFEAIDGLDVGRVDFRLDAGGHPHLVEINTLPGLNPLVSDMVIVSRAEGVPYPRLINEILNLARERYGI
jgi:D-alanine-D-alanine ligase